MSDPPSTAAGRRGTSQSRFLYARASDRAAADRLLAAAARLIAERGTTAFSFGEVAKVAEVAPELPGQLFGTKVTLLCAVIEDFDHRVRKYVLGPAVGRARGLAAVEITLRTILAGLARPWPQARALAILLGEAQGAGAELQAVVNRYHAGLRDTIAEWLRQGIEDGIIRPDVNADAQAAIVISILRGLSYQVVTDPRAVSIPDVESELIGGLCRALAVRPGDRSPEPDA